MVETWRIRMIMIALIDREEVVVRKILYTSIFMSWLHSNIILGRTFVFGRRHVSPSSKRE
jgi:hypothetical protein